MRTQGQIKPGQAFFFLPCVPTTHKGWQPYFLSKLKKKKKNDKQVIKVRAEVRSAAKFPSLQYYARAVFQKNLLNSSRLKWFVSFFNEVRRWSKTLSMEVHARQDSEQRCQHHLFALWTFQLIYSLTSFFFFFFFCQRGRKSALAVYLYGAAAWA